MDVDNSMLFPSPKLVSEHLDYTIDLTRRLQGDTIVSAVWTAPTLTIGSQGHSDTSALVWLSGGAPGRHEINLRVVTLGGRTLAENAVLVVKEG